MSKVYLCSDLHLGHRGISKKYRKDFYCDQEHDNYMVEAWLKVVNKRDTVFCLGDMAMSYSGLSKIGELPGRKILVIGNHDINKEVKTEELFCTYDEISGDLSYKGFWLSHTPVHPQELRSRHGINIHGHVHYATIPDNRYYNVCYENNKRVILDFQELRDKLLSRQLT